MYLPGQDPVELKLVYRDPISGPADVLAQVSGKVLSVTPGLTSRGGYDCTQFGESVNGGGNDCSVIGPGVWLVVV